MAFLENIIKKAGVLIGKRRTINLIQGSNVTITAVDDPANDRVNITISSSGGGGGGSGNGYFPQGW